MKRVLLGIICAVCLGGLFGSVAQAQNVNNFTIQNFETDYYLSQDSEGRSQLKTIEKITAKFPDFDQNHGLERAIPQSYEGHSTSVKIETVTNETGQALPYSNFTDNNDNLVLRIGDANSYVHGEQTYVITSTQRDVTRYFADTNDDEFYWDVNGVEWRVPIESTTARLHIAAPLSDSLNGQMSCYEGTSGSTTLCNIDQTSENNGMIFTATAGNLGRGATMTLAVGFQPQTFTGYQPTLWERIMQLWPIIVLVSSIAAVSVIIWLSVKYSRIMHRAKGRGTIIPEYLPPKNASVLVAGQVVKNYQTDITAQLIDLAVRHYLKIYQTKEKTIWKQAEYELEVTKPLTSLTKEEQDLLKDLFQKSPKPGDKFSMKDLQKSYALRRSLYDRRKKVRDLARGEYGLFERAGSEVRWFMRVGVIMLIAGIVLLSPLVLIAAIVIFIMAHYVWPFTPKGTELRDYLKGLKLYIGVAEEDRLKMLQSPEGAEKVGRVDGEDAKQLVKLYERVLPYAVLFGQEKDWAKQLGVYYENGHTQPDWYAGHGAFNAVMFSSALSGFSTVSSSYSSSSSASTGGSGGGGSAGGGGGGGGGGGW